MADTRRQPEWQQQADRHSKLIDPVLTVRPISRFDYTTRRPVTAIDHALVFATAAGAYEAFVPPHRPTRGNAAAGRYVSVYEVDTGHHSLQLDLQLPSDDDAFAFGVTADLTWRVTDPIGYVRSGERDVPTRLTRELHQFARPVSRRFPIEESSAAEAAVQQALEARTLAADSGLAVTCTVRLRPDDEAIAHRQRKRTLRYETEMLVPQHQFQVQEARQRHELELLRQQQAQELLARKVEFYDYQLRQKGVAAWAVHLAAHPEDTRLVMNGIREDQLSLIKGQLELISGDSLEDYQRTESAKFVLNAVNELIRQQGLTPAEPSPQEVLPPAAAPQETHTPHPPAPTSPPSTPVEHATASPEPPRAEAPAPAPPDHPGSERL
ncbi:PE-PGRS family protein [Streptomyces alboflavus]|uniref:PE-PGRS family protein n=1 Tax=Streptomyces alboflavus TaxID=67267 RepID=UPI0036750E75